MNIRKILSRVFLFGWQPMFRDLKHHIEQKRKEPEPPRPDPREGKICTPQLRYRKDELPEALLAHMCSVMPHIRSKACRAKIRLIAEPKKILEQLWISEDGTEHWIEVKE